MGDMTTYLYLSIAILAEILATTALKASDGISRLGPSLMTALGYATAFYFLALTLRTMLLGITYAIWSGVGIVLISAVGWIWFGQTLDVPAIFGLGLIVAGVVVVNVFSKATVH